MLTARNGSHLTLPELRSAIPRSEEQGPPSERGSPRTFNSASSGTGVTYHFPTAQMQMEGDGNEVGMDDFRSMSSSSGSVRITKDGLASKQGSRSPLPPGAAPPSLTNEADRITQL